jgi:site-specific DNA-cytosine methylase
VHRGERTVKDLKNSEKIILHLCAKQGSDSRPYRDAGYDVRIIGEEIGVQNYHPPENVYGIIANPPCTMFSIARSNAKIPRNFKIGMFCVEECLRIIWQARYKNKLKFWMIENPRGFLRQFLGLPVMTYKRCEFGDDGGKFTDLWGYFNPPIKPYPNRKAERGKYNTESAWFNTIAKSSDARSICSPKFAQAFFKANR